MEPSDPELPQLQVFVERLSGSTFSLYVDQVKFEMDKIFRLLTQKSENTFHRYSLVGGLAKKTSTPIKADADIVIFYNDKSLSKKAILGEFKDILLRNSDMLEENIVISRNDTMQFVKDGISFDLLIAPNLASPNSKNVIEEQRSKSLKMFQQTNDFHDYNERLQELGVQVSESSVEFMKNKSKFVHDVAKLAKYWNHLMLYGDYIYGRSSIMELLAIKAGLEEENNNSNPCLESAFSRFLEKVEKLNEVNVVFTDYYDKNEISNRIMMQSPLLLDPVNPHNNLLSEANHQPYSLTKFMSFIKSAAEQSLYVIDKYGYRDWRLFFPHPYFYFNTAPVKCDDFYEQMKYYKWSLNKYKWLFPKKNSVRHDIYSNRSPEIQNLGSSLRFNMPEVILRDSDGKNNKKDINLLLKAYAGVICTLTRANPNVTQKELLEELDNKEKRNQMNDEEKRRMGYDVKPHSDKAVTLKIPIEGDSSVCISFEYDSDVPFYPWLPDYNIM